ncbi:MAG: DnaJ domain-containing protein [bacterium]
MEPVPKLIKSIHNVAGLTEQETFILSFVDGKTTVREIARVTGIGLSSVNKILNKLVDQKLVIFQHPLYTNTTDEQKQTERSLKELYDIYENADPYMILGVSEHATPEQIKDAYIEKTKMFHPDSYYARTIPVEDKQILVEIYKKIQQAYETLKAKVPSAQPQQHQDLQKPVKPYTPIVKPEQSTQKASTRDILKNSIKQRVRKASEYYRIGIEAFMKNDYSTAYLNFKLANSYNPYEKEYIKKMKEAESLMKVERYEELIKKADISIELNKPEDALNYLKSAVDLTDDKKFLYYRIATVMYDFNHSLKDAKTYCQQAIALDPKNPDYHLLLAKIYKKAGLYKSSIVEFEQAFSLGVKTDEIKAEIKQIKSLIK